MFDYIEKFYNTIRRHSTIGYLSPVEFERKVGLALTRCPRKPAAVQSEAQSPVSRSRAQYGCGQSLALRSTIAASRRVASYVTRRLRSCPRTSDNTDRSSRPKAPPASGSTTSDAVAGRVAKGRAKVHHDRGSPSASLSSPTMANSRRLRQRRNAKRNKWPKLFDLGDAKRCILLEHGSEFSGRAPGVA